MTTAPGLEAGQHVAPIVHTTLGIRGEKPQEAKEPASVGRL